ncbi:MAG: hypothetical protein HPY53_14905 [Brevinematales bacterium]|nr:hypothetical protein [Brevinematales bacterium]
MSRKWGFLITLLLFAGFVSCASTTIVKENGVVKTYDDKGQLLEENYETYGFKKVFENNGAVVKIYKNDDLQVTGYKLISTNEIYTIKNFRYDFSIKMDIPDAYVVIGKTQIGPMAAVIIPAGKEKAEYQKVQGDMEYIYIRSYPQWIQDNVLKNAGKVSPDQEKNAELLKIAKQALDEGFNSCLHINDYAMYDEEFYVCRIKIVPVNIVLSWTSTGKMISPVNLTAGGYGGAMAYEAYWNEYADGIFRVYYPNGSVIQDDPAKWLASRKDAFTRITNFLNVKWTFDPIKYYVFNDKKQGEQMGLTLGFANPYASAVYTTFDQTPGHELTHLIAYRINNGLRIWSGVANEGLSTLLDQSGRNYHLLAKYMIEKQIAFPKLLGDNFRQNKYGYWLGASFVRYLIDTYGMDTYKKFFAQVEYPEKEAFNQFYAKSGVELIKEWTAFLKKTDFGKLTDKDEKAIKMMEGKPAE